MTSNAAARYFSRSYADARERIITVAEQLGADVETHQCNVTGPDGEWLFTDVVTLGDAAARKAVWLISGTHGAEGPFGSAAQLARLDKVEAGGIPDDTQIVLVHAINPYGFVFGTRTNEDNVDLNRNFVDLPVTEADTEYGLLHDALVPTSLAREVWDKADAVLADYEREHGHAAFIRALSSGQYSYPGGLFYGGVEPTWSRKTWRKIVDDRASGMDRLVLVDFHTGLGAPGEVTTLLISPDAERVREYLGSTMQDMHSGKTSSGANMNGMVVFDVLRRHPDIDTTGIVAEIGSLPERDVIQALRIDAFLASKPRIGDAEASRLRAQVKGGFIVECDDWKHAAVVEAEKITDAALEMVSM